MISPGSHKLLRQVLPCMQTLTAAIAKTLTCSLSCQTNPGYKQFRVDNGYKVPGTGMEMTERIARLEEAIGEISKTQKEILNFVAR